MVIVGSGRQSVAHQNTKRTCRSRVVIGAFKLSLGRLHRESCEMVHITLLKIFFKRCLPENRKNARFSFPREKHVVLKHSTCMRHC